MEHVPVEPPHADADNPETLRANLIPGSLDLGDLERIFDTICASHPTSVGKKASAKDRELMLIPQSTLTYGEIKFEPFAAAMLKVGHFSVFSLAVRTLALIL